MYKKNVYFRFCAKNIDNKNRPDVPRKETKKLKRYIKTIHMYTTEIRNQMLHYQYKFSDNSKQ